MKINLYVRTARNIVPGNFTCSSLLEFYGKADLRWTILQFV